MRFKIFFLLPVFFLCVTFLPVLAQSAKEWNQKGMELYKEGKYEEAIKYYDMALKISPEFEQVKKHKEEALKSLNK
ncbi:MAG: tetratricopeptide repeat protein [Candidatus Eremiobacterota bacterium]